MDFSSKDKVQGCNIERIPLNRFLPLNSWGWFSVQGNLEGLLGSKSSTAIKQLLFIIKGTSYYWKSYFFPPNWNLGPSIVQNWGVSLCWKECFEIKQTKFLRSLLIRPRVTANGFLWLETWMPKVESKAWRLMLNYWLKLQFFSLRFTSNNIGWLFSIKLE